MRTEAVENKNTERRQMIIDATAKQVIEKGFHKSSMNEIAKSARLSVGQIYRYFAHKDDIICALVEQITNQRLTMMVYFLDKKNWLSRHFSKENIQNHNMRVLNSEIQAEATRNPKIADICLSSQQKLEKHAVSILQSRYPLMGKIEILARLELLITFTEGLLVRWDYQTHPLSCELQTFCNQMLDTILPDVVSSSI